MRRIASLALTLGVTVALVAAFAAPRHGGAAAVFSADAHEPDGTAATARALTGDSVHTFHSPTDSDWVRISAPRAGATYVIETTPLSGDALNTTLTVFRQNGATLAQVAFNDDHAVFPDTVASGALFVAPEAGTYVVRVAQAWAGAVGSYRLTVAPGVARRIGGADRYDAAAEVSRLVWSSAGLAGWGPTRGPEVIVVAGGDDPAGALCGSVLAAANDSVLLLSRANGLPGSSRAALTRLASSRVGAARRATVYVVGSQAAVGSSVETAIRAIPGVGSVVRLGGSTAAATSARVAAELRATAGTGDTALVVNSSAWADAIAAAPLAATAGAPILFTDAGALPTPTSSALSSLGIRRAIVVGGPASVSPAVATRLQQVTGSVPVRLGGASRYDVGLAVARHGVTSYGMDGRTSVLASGEIFADALSATSIAWWTGGPVLLTSGSALSPQVRTFISEQGPRVLPSYSVGGPRTISAATMGAYTSTY